MVQPLMEDPSFGVGLNGAWRAVLSLSAATNGDWETASVQAKCAVVAIEARPDDAWTATSAALLVESAVVLKDPELGGWWKRFFFHGSSHECQGFCWVRGESASE